MTHWTKMGRLIVTGLPGVRAVQTTVPMLVPQGKLGFSYWQLFF